MKRKRRKSSSRFVLVWYLRSDSRHFLFNLKPSILNLRTNHDADESSLVSSFPEEETNHLTSRSRRRGPTAGFRLPVYLEQWSTLVSTASKKRRARVGNHRSHPGLWTLKRFPTILPAGGGAGASQTLGST